MENSHTNQKASNNQARRQLSRLIFVRIIDVVHVTLFFISLLRETHYSALFWRGLGQYRYRPVNTVRRERCEAMIEEDDTQLGRLTTPAILRRVGYFRVLPQ